MEKSIFTCARPKKYLTNAILAKKFDLRNSRKNYDPWKMLTHVKNILADVTHATHVKVRTKQHTHLPTHATHTL